VRRLVSVVTKLSYAVPQHRHVLQIAYDAAYFSRANYTKLISVVLFFSAVSISVIAGDVDPKNLTGQSVPGIATIHPGYRKNFLINDIALVKLLYPITLGGSLLIIDFYGIVD
jgi:hypothetical protein